MLIRRSVAVAVGVFVLGLAAPAQAQLTQVFAPGALNGPLTVHDFESGPGGPGATYSQSAGSPTTGNSCIYAACVVPSGSNGLTSTVYPSILTINFTGGTGSLGLWFGNDDVCCTGGFTAYLDAYNGSGLIGTVGVVANMNDATDQFIGFNSTQNVTYATFRYGSGSDVSLYNYVDDVSFGPAVTSAPEPATLGLLATGLVGVFGAARRRKTT